MDNKLNTLYKVLTNPVWRLNNLYTIRDKNGKPIPFKENHAQRTLTNIEHPLKLVLKSRQQGVSTYYLLKNLDSCIFIDGYQAGIQSYGKNESKKLYKRALYSWENLDPLIKQALNIRLIASNSEGLEFSNGSILKIGNFRGDTLQSLHISELAKISIKYPDKAEELRIGAFQAVGQGNIITIETTAEGANGLFPDMWNNAITLQDSKIPITTLDFLPIFLSWMDDADCVITSRLLFIEDITTRFIEYLQRLQKEFSLSVVVPTSSVIEEEITSKLATNKAGLPPLVLNESQLVWLVVKLRSLGNKFSQEYPATPTLAFEQSIEGTYFKIQYDIILEENRLLPLTYDSSYGVYTSWDIGVNDEGVILFWQIIYNEVRLIDEYHATGEGISHYVDILKVKGYSYINHFMPFDVGNTSYSTGRTRLETFRRYGISNIVVLPKIGFDESIQGARDLMVDELMVNSNCTNTITAIRSYRKKYDAKIGAYLPTDVHDIHSNYMAGFRYGALGISKYVVRNSNNINNRRPVKRGLAI